MESRQAGLQETKRHIRKCQVVQIQSRNTRNVKDDAIIARI